MSSFQAVVVVEKAVIKSNPRFLGNKNKVFIIMANMKLVFKTFFLLVVYSYAGKFNPCLRHNVYPPLQCGEYTIKLIMNLSVRLCVMAKKQSRVLVIAEGGFKARQFYDSAFKLRLPFK